MTKAQLLKQLEPFSDDAQVCIYEDNAYWNVKPALRVEVITEPRGGVHRGDVKIGDILITSYEATT